MDADDTVVRLGVDVGGTFTDVVLLVGDDRTTAKVPTTDDQSHGVIDGIETACAAADIDLAAIDQFRHATTVSVNALLEGTGATTALVTTEGFRDVLAIGRQDRPALYDLSARKPTPLVPRERRYEIEERTLPDGIVQAVDDTQIDTLAEEIQTEQTESVAVALLHAYARPENERRVADRLDETLPVPVTASHDVLAEFREYERTATTVAEAYVTPAVDSYLGHLETQAADCGLPAPRVMQANGGIADTETVREHAVTTVLSGPAAGVVGASAFARVHGNTSPAPASELTPDTDTDTETNIDTTATAPDTGLVTFDMGGTSSDVSLVRNGEIERTTDADVGGYPVRIPMVDVHTVGAGGGSIAWVDAGGALRVGPRSAGANPGPACYDRGGTEPTVTDANLVLGYLGTDTTLGKGLNLHTDAAESALSDLADQAGIGAGAGDGDEANLDLDGPLAAARGVYRIANATMTRAIRRVTVERGHDPREFALVAFGGAGPMHAAALADRLDIETVVIPPAEGVLSALGLLAADEKHDAVRTHRTPVATIDVDTIEGIYDELATAVLAKTADSEAATLEREADCRYAGQSFELTVPAPDPFDPAAVAERFHETHERVRGYRMDNESVTVVNLRTTATVPSELPSLAYDPDSNPQKGKREAFFPTAATEAPDTTDESNDDGFHETPVFARDRVPPGETYRGPAIFEGGESTVVLPPDWTATVDDDGTLVLEVAT